MSATVTHHRGKHLERLVAAIHHAESSGADVRWNDTIAGRQFDVTVRFRFGIHSYLTIIECKDYSRKIPVEKVDAFVTKTRDAQANKIILISSQGFQSGCLDVANRHGVQLLTLTETVDISAPELAAKMKPVLDIYNVQFTTNSGLEHKLDDWGGRLTYLMNHAQLRLPHATKSPNQLVSEWRLSHPAIEFDRENHIELPLPPRTTLKTPYEEEVPVTGFRFTCALVEIAISKKTFLDRRFCTELNTQVELRDTKGKLQYSAQLNDLQLGYDTPIQVGSFYYLPTMFSHYYCTKIKDDLISWILIESYQHGNLFQAEYTQKLKYSGHYVEVTDTIVLKRLRAMLAHFQTIIES